MANPSSFVNLEAVRQAIFDRMARVGEYVAEDFRRMLSDEGSGELWWQFQNPNRSSTTREYPAMQHGNLRDSVGMELPGEHNKVFVGFISDNDAEGYEEGLYLEAEPPSKGGRQPIQHYLGTGRFSGESDGITALREAIEQ